MLLIFMLHIILCSIAHDAMYLRHDAGWHSASSSPVFLAMASSCHGEAPHQERGLSSMRRCLHLSQQNHGTLSACCASYGTQC